MHRQMSAPASYSTEYCSESFYDPVAKKSHAVPRLKPRKEQYSVTLPTCYSRQTSVPVTTSGPLATNFIHWKRIDSIEIQESKV